MIIRCFAGSSLGVTINDNISSGGNYEIIWHYISSDNKTKLDVKLTLTGFVTSSTQS